jgi:WD40 repeat protein
VNVQITAEDSIRDIRLYLETHADDLPAEDEVTRKGLVEKMVRKSAGCFLWTVLVMRQLQEIYTSDEIDEVLQEVPEEMDELYRRNLQIMESRPRTKKLAQTVLIWTLCATRALTLDELKDAIRLDVGIVVVRDLERSISTLCSQFLFVDKQNKIQIVHETARTFLLNPDLKSEFRVQMPLGNVQLGLTCLRCLTSDDMAVRINRGGSKIHALAEYASLSFSEHLVHSTSSSDALFLALMEFLQKNVLVWIERMARENNLGYLMKTAMHLKAYQAIRAKHVAPLQDIVSSWAIDLPRIVTVFGSNLSNHPEAIYHIIPPLCPRSSGIYRQFGALETSLQLRGFSEPEWNDRISCWYYGQRARTIACQDRWFAIGLSDGMVHIYWTSTCQESVKMNHGESVRILRFGNLAGTLVSTGLRMVKFWDVSTGSLLWEYRINSDPLAVDFDDDDKKLVVATRSKKLFTWSTINGILISQDTWHHKLPLDDHHVISRAPSTIVMSSSHKLMAIVYRSMPLCLWDLDKQQQLGLCTKTSDDGRDTSDNIISACFNPVQALNLIAVAYMDGDIALFDTLLMTMKCHAKVQTHLLAASPDGRTLAGGDSDGNIKLFDFETLQLLYHINLSSDGVGAVAFTGDSLRLMELRGAQANVWEPSALVRKWNYADDDFSSEAPAKFIQDARTHSDYEENITVIQAVYEESMAICGRANGSVGICDISSSEPAFQELYKHKGASILSLDWNESHRIVATGDAAGRFKVMRLVNDRQNIVTVSDEHLAAHLPYLHSIGQLMISPDGKKLLVSSSTADFVWSLQTRKLILSRETEARTDWRWLPHLQESTKLMLLENSLLQTFSWNASTVFTPESETAIHIGNRRLVDLKSMAIQTNNNRLILKLGIKEDRELSSAVHDAEETSLYALDLSEFKSQPESLLPEPLFLSEGVSDLPRVKALLGLAPGSFGGLLLVFIAESGWICSIDLNTPSPHSTFQRHFFIPSAWLSTNTRIVSAITTRKDILFVRDHEVAIIKNGLEAVEVIRLS